MKVWIEKRLIELMGMEDDIVINFAISLLEDSEKDTLCPKKLQISLTGFLENNTATFVQELWELLLSA